ncbi:DinB family protein [Pseudooceanicola algae]|uniref:Uncharacterized protein n=1 Tax=Pseudooceanicola algae TaxID=1537215 RepID=A0A418SEB3_9RHOB|nr:DinB family protein [Pseudooceanicola algae]QPM89696.1 hypothetical protein PSAL_009210 [Pseudooceanicola algae]
MITPDYCRTMARYNAWQNRSMRLAMETLSLAELLKDRGAFFGSILGTANHLLWGDAMWMSRFSDWPKPNLPGAESPRYMPTLATWGAERFRLDAHILYWSDHVKALDLTGDLSWYSGVAATQMRKPRALLVMQLFNHQTHHRGQIHAMLTAAGCRTQDTDLPYMPQQGPWL